MFNDVKEKADIGIFGGSGFYKFLDDIKEVQIETPYGSPSDSLMLGTICDKKVAFLPRHGRKHTILPHQINYRANVWAMRALGVKRVISPCAVGSLQKEIAPGDFVIVDQFVNWTSGRKDTFFEGPICTHISAADPYCPELRDLAVQAAQKNNVTVHQTGTMLVINGPRFSTKAESKFYTSQGWSVIGMTNYPESHLVKEFDMCPVTICLVTDYDAGLVSDTEPVSHSAVIEVFEKNITNLKKVLFDLIEVIPQEQKNCYCFETLKRGRL
ncbi:MAG: S-methyl-5'-thioadenosine phosphorylase [Candidatus Gastranaerophilales bacterium]|nr:S-methyl-5'-thioadenosine phosphorylase [Candidatus Gastranaerophilales bacterium]